jgi:hypothetical protein
VPRLRLLVHNDLVHNDANHRWLLRVPRRSGARDIIDVDETDQRQPMTK